MGTRRRSMFFFQAEDGIRDVAVTGVQTCALPIYDVARVERHDRAGRVCHHDHDAPLGRRHRVWHQPRRPRPAAGRRGRGLRDPRRRAHAAPRARSAQAHVGEGHLHGRRLDQSRSRQAQPTQGRELTPMATVDQQRVRRTRTGLIAHDPGRAFAGYTLFTPMFGDGTVYLVDMHGDAVHTWRMPYRPGLYGYLLDNGHLFYSGKVMEDLGRFEAWARFKAGAALEVDWNGKTVWEIKHPDHHHDARKLRNGNVVLLCLRPLPPELHARVKGGLPGTEVRGTIYADYLIEITTRGEIVWEW